MNVARISVSLVDRRSSGVSWSLDCWRECSRWPTGRATEELGAPAGAGERRSCRARSPLGSAGSTAARPRVNSTGGHQAATPPCPTHAAPSDAPSGASSHGAAAPPAATNTPPSTSPPSSPPTPSASRSHAPVGQGTSRSARTLAMPPSPTRLPASPPPPPRHRPPPPPGPIGIRARTPRPPRGRDQPRNLLFAKRTTSNRRDCGVPSRKTTPATGQEDDQNDPQIIPFLPPFAPPARRRRRTRRRRGPVRLRRQGASL